MHPSQDLKLFCINCDQVACHNCTILLHKGHKFESIDRVKQRIINKFKETVDQNQRYNEHINGTISRLAGSISKVNEKADVVEVSLKISKFFHLRKCPLN